MPYVLLNRIRKHGPLTLTNIEQVMNDEWYKITKRQIHAHYKHCKLMHRDDVYDDCPSPHAVLLFILL